MARRFIERLLRRSRGVNKAILSRGLPHAASSVFDVRLQVKRAHDVPLIRNLTNSSEQPTLDFIPSEHTIVSMCSIAMRQLRDSIKRELDEIRFRTTLEQRHAHVSL